MGWVWDGLRGIWMALDGSRWLRGIFFNEKCILCSTLLYMS